LMLQECYWKYLFDDRYQHPILIVLMTTATSEL